MLRRKKKKEIELLMIEHALFSKEDRDFNEEYGITEEDIRRSEERMEKLVRHLEREVQPGEKVLVEIAPYLLEMHRQERLTGRQRYISDVVPAERAWRKILNIIWDKDADVTSYESPYGQKRGLDPKIEVESWALGPLGRIAEAWGRKQIANYITYPLREGSMARRIAREMQSDAQIMRAIGGVEHYLYLPRWLKHYGISARVWKNSTVSPKIRREIQDAYSHYSKKMQEKRRRHKELSRLTDMERLVYRVERKMGVERKHPRRI